MDPQSSSSYALISLLKVTLTRYCVRVLLGSTDMRNKHVNNNNHLLFPEHYEYIYMHIVARMRVATI
jgi:CRISPR/Cas system-associated protein endoribonuclease Cas2